MRFMRMRKYSATRRLNRSDRTLDDRVDDGLFQFQGNNSGNVFSGPDALVLKWPEPTIH